jgi:hypothetical protein
VTKDNQIGAGTVDSTSVTVPAGFVAYVESALVRLGYLYPDVTWSFDPDIGLLKAAYEPGARCGEVLAKEASFQLYRERIYRDTLEIRRKIYEAI